MPTPLQIGVTGGIGAGKSLVCRIFGCLGVPAYDADSRAKNLMTTDGILIQQIKKEFGTLSYNPDGTLNRKYIGEAAFQDQDKLQALNNLVHPRVEQDYEGWLARQDHPYIVKEAALLFETGSYKKLDNIIVVTAPAEIRIKRVAERDHGRTEQMIRDIMKNQMPETDKAKKADYLIINDERQLVIPQVIELHRRFTA